jgi:5-methyltetrahydrofolate--homocysteine methyltransferase
LSDALAQHNAEAVAAGMTPETILAKGLIAGMTVVGVLFKNNDIFVPEVLMSARYESWNGASSAVAGGEGC